MALQSENVSIADAQAYFDTVLEEYPQLDWRLSSTASTDSHPNLKPGIVKVMENKVSNMSSS